MPAYRDTNPTLPNGIPARSRYSGVNRQPQRRMTRGNTVMLWTVGLILLFTVLGNVTNHSSTGNPKPTPTVTVTVTQSPINTGVQK